MTGGGPIRIILFRIIEQALGTWLALAISAAVFGLVHLANPNATLFAALAIALEAGVLLGTAFVLTRRLWLAIGIHFAWNFTQSGIVGSNVSGVSVGGLIESRLSGPELISGGALDTEGSVFAIALCLVAGVVFLVQAHGAGHVTRPFDQALRTHVSPDLLNVIQQDDRRGANTNHRLSRRIPDDIMRRDARATCRCRGWCLSLKFDVHDGDGAMWI